VLHFASELRVALFVAVFGSKGGSTGARSTITRPALVKVVSSEERLTNLDVDALSAATSRSERLEPALASVEPLATAPVATSVSRHCAWAWCFLALPAADERR
jgi:hypothetical protein